MMRIIAIWWWGMCPAYAPPWISYHMQSGRLHPFQSCSEQYIEEGVGRLKVGKVQSFWRQVQVVLMNYEAENRPNAAYGP
jgi:hypothetical protein